MKKILIALMLIIVVIVPMFAEDTGVNVENKSEMKVTTHVELINKFGFTGNEVDAKADNLGETLTSEAITKEKLSVTIYGSLITNSKEVRTLSVSVTKLANKASNSSYVIPMTVTIGESAVELSKDNTSITKDLLTEATGTSGKRAVSKGFTLSVTEDALKNAEVGDYESTVTMVVTGNN